MTRDWARYHVPERSQSLVVLGAAPHDGVRSTDASPE